MFCAVPVFQHPDPNLACDPLSTNHRLPETADLAKFGTMVVAGSSTDHIKVLIPDTVGPTVDADSPVVLQHVVGLSLGPAVDLSSSLPPTDLALALCDNSVLPTLTRRRRAYWAQINPILRKWQSINDARCPACDRLIRVNMSRHLRLSHTFCQCFWRCPVPSCPMWFASELNGKDHLERIHSFTEGRGYSFYDCLRQFGLEWFGRRSFFDQRDTTGQALWMDLVQKSGQELHDDYVLTSNPAFGNLWKFFRVAVRELIHSYIDYPRPHMDTTGTFLTCDQTRQDIDDSPQGSSRTSPVDQVVNVPVVESLSPLSLSFATPPPPVVDKPVRSLTPNNRSLSFLFRQDRANMPIYMFLNPGEQSPWPLLQVQIYFTTWSHYRWTNLFCTTHRPSSPGRTLQGKNFSPSLVSK